MNHFRLKTASFDFGVGTTASIEFVATPTGSQSRQTHFTLLMGANGSYKSRALAGCVDLLRYQNSLIGDEKPESPSECCLYATIESDGRTSEIGTEPLFQSGNQFLPSRVLALSNLVRDKFTFGGRDEEDNPNRFYYYLGVRQATNLTTTGAMDRIVTDAFLEVLPDTERRELLFKWIGKLFANYELAYGFSHLRPKSFDDFLQDPTGFYAKLRGRSRPGPSPRELEEIPEYRSQIESLQPYIERWRNQRERVVSSSGSQRSQVVTGPLNQLSENECSEIARLRPAFEAALLAGL